MLYEITPKKVLMGAQENKFQISNFTGIEKTRQNCHA